MSKASTATATCSDWRSPNDDLDSAGDVWPEHDYYCWMCRVMYTAEEVMVDE